MDKPVAFKPLHSGPENHGEFRHLASGLTPLISVLKEHGIDHEPLLEEAGIEAGVLTDTRGSIDPVSELRFTELAIALLNDPGLGLTVGARWHVSAMGILGLAIMTSKSLYDALAVILDNILLTWTYFSVEARVENDVAIFEYETIRDLGRCYRYMVDRDMRAICQIATEAIGCEFPLLQVNVEYNDANCPDKYASAFRCPINFNAENNDFRFDARLLNHPLTQSQVDYSSLYLQMCGELKISLCREPLYAEKVRREIAGAMGRRLSLESLAAKLGTRPRSLRRKLAREGTSYRQLRDEVRQNLAVELLEMSTLPVETVAQRLGYSETASFNRAFHRWTGQSPRDYRRRRR